MVNRYISSAQAERESPYASNPQQSAASQYSQQRYEQQKANETQQQRDARTSHWDQARQEMVAGPPDQADRAYYQSRGAQLQQGNANPASARPGYYDPNTLGDLETQRRLNETPANANRNAELGRILEQQRQEAVLTPGKRDDDFYLRELEKWGHNPIEVSGAYHEAALATERPQAANPFENQGDVALAFEKGGNPKDFTQQAFGFNPNVGGMIDILPGGRGTQETAWESAVTGKTANVDFMPAIDYLNAQEGRYGPYGALAGGKPDVIQERVVTPQEMAPDQYAGASTPTPGQGTTGKDWNPFVASAAEPIGYISEGIQIPGNLPENAAKTSSEINLASVPLLGMFAVEGKFLGQELKFDAGDLGRYFNAPITTVTEKGTPVISGGNQTITNLGNKITIDKGLIANQQSEIESLIQGNVTPAGEYKGTEAGYLALTGKIEVNKNLVESTNRDVDTYNAMSKENPIITTTPVSTNTTVGKSQFQLQFDKPITDFVAGIESKSRQGLESNQAYQEAIKNTPEQKPIINLGAYEPTQYTTALAQPFFEKSVQYFKEEPVTGFGVKVAEGYIIAEGFGLLSSGFTKSAEIAKPFLEAPGVKGTIARAATTGGTFLMENAGKIFIAGYGAKTAYEASEGGTNFEPKPFLSKVGGQIGTDAPVFLGMYMHGGGSRIAEAPETLRGGYEYAKAGVSEIPGKWEGFKKSIPTTDQMYYKYVELKTPGTAMGQPMPSERFTVERTPGSGSTSRFNEAIRVAERSSGTRPSSERGTVSGRPTLRQESLRLNYNPTAPLKEIKTTYTTTMAGEKGQIGGIRGTLRGKWDRAITSTEGVFAKLPLKERWKAREGVLSGGAGSGYISGGGTPTGTLQSGVGEGGTTVRSGRQYLDIKMPSSGIVSLESSLAPQQFEITPSRRTAQRSRAYDMDFEYESRRLPQGMTRPGPTQDTHIAQTQSPITENVVTPAFVQSFDIMTEQRSRQNWIQDSLSGQRTISSPIQIGLQKQQQKQDQIQFSKVDFTQESIQTPRIDQMIIPVQEPKQKQQPFIAPIQTVVPIDTWIKNPWEEITAPRKIPPDQPYEYPKFKPDIPIPTPFIFPNIPSGPGGYPQKRRGRKFTEYFPIGLDISAQSVMGVKRKHTKAKKGRLIPKSMLTKRKKK